MTQGLGSRSCAIGTQISRDLGFRVWGTRHAVCGPSVGFRVWGFGLRVWGLGFRVWELGFGV